MRASPTPMATAAREPGTRGKSAATKDNRGHGDDDEDQEQAEALGQRAAREVLVHR